MVETLAKNPKVQPIISNMQKVVESKSLSDVNVSDILSTQIVHLSGVLEEMYTTFDMFQLVEDICGNIVKIMKYANLERYIYLPYKILPDKFKNLNKDNHTNNNDIATLPNLENPDIVDTMFSQVNTSIVQNKYEELDEQVDLKTMTTTDLETAFSHHNRMGNKYVTEFERRGIEIENKTSNALEELSRIEKQRFKKANIAPPIVTAEELTQDQIYAKHFEELKKTIKAYIKAIDLVYDWFIVRYPPISVEDVIKLNSAFDSQIEMFRPFFDDKYRLDHYKGVILAYVKVEETSQKASKLSRVMCTRARDKNGNLEWRGMTKEQIDACYDWEINFWRRYINEKEWMMKYISEVNSRHGERTKADRQVELSGHLSHHA